MWPPKPADEARTQRRKAMLNAGTSATLPPSKRLGSGGSPMRKRGEEALNLILVACVNMDTPKTRYAIVRPVPDSYDRCVRTNIEKIDMSLAKKQHENHCKALEELGLKLIWIKGDSSLPDSCFVEDTAVIFGEKAVICNMKIESRAKEVTEVAKILRKFKKTYSIRFPATIDGWGRTSN